MHAPQIVPPLAPEERHVYSSATHPIPALQNRNVVLSHTVKPVGVGSPNPRGNQAPTEGDSILPFAPEGAACLYERGIAARHVQSPRSRGAQCGIVHTVKPVGVGSPNPLGRKPSPYDGCRKCPAFSPSGATEEEAHRPRGVTHVSLQRTRYAIAARHNQAPRGATCGIVAHR